MLKGIDNRLNAEVLACLRAMGHGDVLIVADTNFPSDSVARATVTGRLLRMENLTSAEAVNAILSVLPLDTFVPAPVTRMEVVGDPSARVPVFDRMQAVIDAAEGRPVTMQALERFAFYAAARRAFAIVRTADSGPYGCFILKKGVVDLPPL